MLVQDEGTVPFAILEFEVPYFGRLSAKPGITAGIIKLLPLRTRPGPLGKYRFSSAGFRQTPRADRLAVFAPARHLYFLKKRIVLLH